jgi:hypothetical protein
VSVIFGEGISKRRFSDPPGVLEYILATIFAVESAGPGERYPQPINLHCPGGMVTIPGSPIGDAKGKISPSVGGVITALLSFSASVGYSLLRTE